MPRPTEKMRKDEMRDDPFDWKGLPISGPLFRPSEAANFLGLSRSTLYELIAQGSFPPFVKLSERASGVPKSWLEAFVAHRASISQANR